MISVLQISGGTYTIDLNSASYQLAKGWRPRVAPYHPARLGGRPHYQDVTETIPIIVLGSSNSELATRVNQIAVTVNQISRYHDIEEGSPILLKADLGNGSTYCSMILSATMDVSDRHVADMATAGQTSTYVYLTITRRGLWINDGSVTNYNTQTSGIGSIRDGEVDVVIGTKNQGIAPLDTIITIDGWNQTQGAAKGFMFIGPSDHISRVNLASYNDTSYTNLTPVSDSNANGASKLQNGAAAIGRTELVSVPSTLNYYYVYLKYQTLASYSGITKVHIQSIYQWSVETQTIYDGANKGGFLVFGPLKRNEFNQFRIVLEPDANSSPAGSVIIDDVALVAPGVHVNKVEMDAGTDTDILLRLFMVSNYAESMVPLLRVVNDRTNVLQANPISVSGNAFINFDTRFSTVRFLLYLVSDSGPINAYQWMSGATYQCQVSYSDVAEVVT